MALLKKLAAPIPLPFFICTRLRKIFLDMLMMWVHIREGRGSEVAITLEHTPLVVNYGRWNKNF